MPGGIMQLTSVGAADVYLTGSPQMTLFKNVYKRHTNFSLECVEHVLDGRVGFGRTTSVALKRCGDLVTGASLRLVLPPSRGSPSKRAFVAAGAELEARLTDTVTDIDALNAASHAVVESVRVVVDLVAHALQEETPEFVMHARFIEDIALWDRLVPGQAGHAERAHMAASLAWRGAYYLGVAASGDVWRYSSAHAVIESVDVEIGGQLIDRHYGEWLHVWHELTGRDDITEKVVNGVVIVPLAFWFCRHPGLALPLIALQYHEVRLHCKFRKLAECVKFAPAGQTPVAEGDLEATLLVDYVYLDTEERRRFARRAHEYVIPQLQRSPPMTLAPGQQLALLHPTFNHPCVEMVWTVRDARAPPLVFCAASGENPIRSAKLQLNGHDRFASRDGMYFDTVQPYQYHTRSPRLRGINVYSFALRPESVQPSGSCNMSRIDQVTLRLRLRDALPEGGELTLYATCWNVLRVESGMGGLRFAT
jgi:hypothetical protein